VIAISGIGDAERFRSIVARRLGLQFEDAKLGLLADVLRRRLGTNGRISVDYLMRLEAEESREELGAIAQELTVPETYFYRNIEQFRAFAELVLPERMRRRAARRSLRILSAGCASGEEAYTIAILVREALVDSAWDISISAVDINRAVLDKASRARFTAWALRETPAEARQRWFKRNGNEFALDDMVRNAVTFAERNLADADAELWRPDSYDVVFCRNVMMYFTPQNAQALVMRITNSLAPGGFLFLGHAETLRGLSQEYHLHHTHETFYYQRKDGTESAPPRFIPEAMRSNVPVPVLPAIIDSADDTWVDAIRKAAERIHTLTQVPAVDSMAAKSGLGWDLGLALDLLRKERFAQALELVAAFPAESARDADVLLLRAVLLTHHSRLAEAEEACQRLLEFDELNAGAHYVLALCREGAGDCRGAVDHDQVAVYLDSAFAMPHLHLGLLARRRGDRDAMQRELRQALVLLQREDASRLLLFGGGFTREALLALCRAELRVDGGSS
jgi:chemotaxis protein methyltransferase CheR